MNTITSPALTVLTAPDLAVGAQLLDTIAAALLLSHAEGPSSEDQAGPVAWSIAEAWSAALTAAWGYAFDVVPDDLRNLL